MESTRKTGRRKSSLARKFFIGITLILLFSLLLSLLINTRFVERYYLYRQTGYLRQIGDELVTALGHGADVQNAVSELEQREKVLIAYSESPSDSETLSMELRDKFREKGLGFQKFWLWEQDYQTVMEKGKTMRIYNQDKLNYGILVEYLSAKEGLFALASIVPDTSQAVAIINQFLIILHAFSLLTATMLLGILVRHITNPLKQIQHFSQDITRQVYGTLAIRTNDELETVASAMNQMGQSLKQYQEILQEKNEQMEGLLNNVAHDLKTPIALIGTYASGIRDGLDDGTFLDTIIRQNTKMALIVERLLDLSRISRKESVRKRVSLSQLLFRMIEEQQILAKSRNVLIRTDIEHGVSLTGNSERIGALFSNLLSNSIKYTASGEVKIRLIKGTGRHRLIVSNEISNPNLDLKRIWEPFYVGEASRNKELSGTGLGLSIVKKISEQENYPVNCTIENSRIQFEVILPEAGG